jgi:hypothetical protein
MLRLTLAAAGMLLLACGGNDDAEKPALAPGELAVRVCGDDPNWRRPTLEQQRAYVIADPRYREFGAGNAEQFEAHFWGAGHSASGAGFILEFSGMWSLPNEGKDFYWAAYDRCFGEFAGDMPARDQYLPLWLFEHEAVSAREDDGGIEVEVQPREAGVQIIAVHLRKLIYGRNGDVVFVDGEGLVIEELKSLWSTPP